MTISRLFGKIAGPVLCAALASGISACSDSKGDGSPGTSGAGNVAGSASAGSNSAAGSNSGGSTAGSNSVAGSNSGGSGPFSQQVVGTFQVQVLGDDADPRTGMTKIVGQVGDAPVPLNVVWTVTKEEGGCRLEKPSAPFCEPACGADVCVAENECRPYPTNHSVGAVTLQGVQLTTGGSDLTLKEIAKAYQPPAGTAIAYPPFGADDDVSLHAAGGDYAAFELSTKGVDPLAFTSSDFALDTGKPFVLTWDAPADPKSSQLYVKLDISHHGGAKGLIECDVDDTGSLTISAALVSELMGLGVAGFPSVIAIRQSFDTAQIEPGLVRLEVSTRAEHSVSITGVDSCTTDTDCATGEKCQMDLTCK